MSYSMPTEVRVYTIVMLSGILTLKSLNSFT